MITDTSNMLHQYKKTIYNAVIITLNSSFEIIENGYIIIEGNKIIELGSGFPAETGNLYDAGGKIIIPGFINAHTHLPMTMYRGIADDLPLKVWLEEHIWPAEAAHTREDTIRKATRLGLEEMIKTGTTTFCDMYFFAEEVAEETARIGLRGVMNEAILDFPTNSYKTVDEALAKTEKFLQKWEQHPLITPIVAFHSTYTCSKITLIKIKKLADKYGVIMSTHISETQDENETVLKQKGLTPTQYLNSLAQFSPKNLNTHCVRLTPEDQQLFADTGASVVHCPSSNLKLGSGVAPIPTYIQKGINVALGTDGCASNNNLDMVEEMRMAALLHKGVSLDPTVIPAREALKMATLNGAKALGLADKIGSLEVGKLADMVLISRENTFMNPIYDYYSAIVYAMNSSCIDTVIVDGKVLMENGNVKFD